MATYFIIIGIFILIFVIGIFKEYSDKYNKENLRGNLRMLARQFRNVEKNRVMEFIGGEKC